MKPAQRRVTEGHRQTQPGIQVFGKLGVERRRKATLSSHTICARGEPERSLGRYVDPVGDEAVEKAREHAAPYDREANRRVGRARHGAKEIGRDREDLVAGGGQAAEELR